MQPIGHLGWRSSAHLWLDGTSLIAQTRRFLGVGGPSTKWRLMRLGLPLKRIPRRASFVKPKKTSPPRSPTTAGLASGAGKFRSSHLCIPMELLPTYTRRVRIAIPEIDGMLEIPVLVPQT